MPFGLTNEPTNFQATMNDFFRPFLRTPRTCTTCATKVAWILQRLTQFELGRYVPRSRAYEGFATIAAPISNLLRKGQSFEWTKVAQGAMEHLKSRLCSALVETDAYGTRIGAVLTQEGKPLAYFNQKLSPRMQSASTYNREMFAITQVVWKWSQYLVGHKFIIIIDQRSLRELNQ
ncbi:Retrovirus-related Pol polyprotein from transposon 297 family [Gossypium australe]|uniref:Retrovirus-related Pol polyprotein from transposon 297 family n=1 Tax=Gossypium australe TaxID=47621 RepID=A0A5B6WST5_9ROSI|nr:Retrovirus-related Pol polyprotein from transposon 297 family [Gossypium australe]